MAKPPKASTAPKSPKTAKTTSPSDDAQALSSDSAASGAPHPPAAEAVGSILATVAGPARPPAPGDRDRLTTEAQRKLGLQKAGAQLQAAEMPFNALKGAEHGVSSGQAAPEGQPASRADACRPGRALVSRPCRLIQDGSRNLS